MLPENSAPIRRKLLNWYDRNRRDLPWRRTGDPYAIWIAETMLQQTQVAIVLPYYEKFLRAFPTIQALDRAPLERVLRAWSGLGYYRRAANLKKAARQISAVHGGVIPSDFSALRRLPGIGDYTAGALMSIAFHRPYPAVDGNVRRVLGRLFALTDPARLRPLASELVPSSRPGDFNQALMELGATLCLPRDPRCDECPLSSHCPGQANQRDSIERPVRREKFKSVAWPLAIVRQRGRVLLRRRGAIGILARLWELPGGESGGGTAPRQFLRRELIVLNRTIERLNRIGEIRHSITFRRIRAPVYLIEFPAGAKLRLPDKHWRWIKPKSLANLAVSTMTAKALKLMPP